MSTTWSTWSTSSSAIQRAGAAPSVNAGGGREYSLSLLETTELCRELTGNEIEIAPEPENRPGDVPIYLSDCSRLFARTSWRPRRTVARVLADVLAWTLANEDAVREALGFGKAAG